MLEGQNVPFSDVKLHSDREENYSEPCPRKLLEMQKWSFSFVHNFS